MSKVFSVEVVVFVSLFISCIRPFFKFKSGVRRCAFFSPFAMVVCILGVLSLNVNCSFVVLSALSLAIFVINIPYLSAREEDFQYSFYSIPFLIMNFFLLLILLAAGVFTWYFRVPGRPLVDGRQIPLERNVEQFCGDFSRGFSPRVDFRSMPNAVFHIIYPTKKDSDEICLYIPETFTSVDDCMATIEALAEQGKIVVAADFFCPSVSFFDSHFDNRWTRHEYMRLQNFLDKSFAGNNRNNWDAIKSKELTAITQILPKIESKVFKSAWNKDSERKKIIVVAGKEAFPLLEGVFPRFFGSYTRYYCINSAENPIPGYRDGFGDLAVFHPFEYYISEGDKTGGWMQAKLIASKIGEMK